MGVLSVHFSIDGWKTDSNAFLWENRCNGYFPFYIDFLSASVQVHFSKREQVCIFVPLKKKKKGSR